MAFCIVMGTHDFRRRLEEYPRVDYYCENCPNYNGRCEKSWSWFTICFVPVIPFSTGWKREVVCYTCSQKQDLRDRPDITEAPHGLGGQGGQGQPLQQGVLNGGYGGGPPQQQQASYK